MIFPEGGNFTPGRHRRAVARLRRLGQYRRAARAARLHYVLPPRNGGSLAALAAAPAADVVFVAHAGLDVIASPRAAWAQLPFRRPVRIHWWRIAAADIPQGEEARGEWLLGSGSGWTAGPPSRRSRRHRGCDAGTGFTPAAPERTGSAAGSRRNAPGQRGRHSSSRMVASSRSRLSLRSRI